MDLFDDTRALFLTTEKQDDAQTTFVATGSGPFLTGGNDIHVTATIGPLGAVLTSQLACTITGQSS